MNDSSVHSEISRGVGSIPFSKIPGQSKLFVDFQFAPEKLLNFYPNAVRSHHELVAKVPGVLEAYRTARKELCDVLRGQQTTFGAGAAAFENVDLLSGPKTVAVVTGQQAGLFSGPLYTIYKALSAVRLAECLREKGTPAVPVFWAATEDHDFDEVASVKGLDGSGRIFEVSNRPANHVEGRSVGNVVLDDSILSTIAEFSDSLGRGQYSSAVRDLLKDAYRPGRSFGGAFCELVARLFEPYGLIVVDPLDDRIKSLCRPIYKSAAENVVQINSRLTERDAELKAAGYHSQVLVTPEYVPIFWHGDDGVRRSLKLKPKGELAVHGTRESLSLSQLADIAQTSPSRFSPGVMLRPVVQDYLFPTVCYVGGGAEIAYFAQNSVVYETLGRPATTSMHRQSFTVVEAKHRRTMEKFDLDLIELFSGYDALVPHIVGRFVDPDGVRSFADAEEVINGQLNKLDQYVSRLDPTIAENLATRRRKIVYHIAALRTKFERARLKKDVEIERRLRAVTDALAPEGGLQERTVNLFSFFNKFGPAFIDRIYSSIELDDKAHRVVNV